MSQRSLDFRRLLSSLLLAFGLFCALSFDMTTVLRQHSSLSDALLSGLKTYGLIGNIYTFTMAAVIYMAATYWRQTQKHIPTSLIILALISGFLTAASLFLFHTDTLPVMRLGSMALFIFCGCAWSLISLFLFCGFWLLIEHAEKCPNKDETSKLLTILEKHIFLITFLLIVCGWLPWIVSYYPASMEWDVYDPILRYLRIWEPSNHHPWFYACIIGSAYQLGDLLGDKNLGVFLYTVIRAICMAAIYSHCVSSLRKNNVPLAVCFGVSCFFAVTPVWGAYAKHAFKDSIAAACFCWFMTTIVEAALQIKKRSLNYKCCLQVSITTLLCALFRNNFIYVVFPVVLLFAIAIIIKRQKLVYALLMLSSIIIFQVWNIYIFNFLHVIPGVSKEAFSIPFQQTARTVKFCSDSITEEEKHAIQTYLKYEELADQYDPIISDPVKDLANSGGNGIIPYLKIWAKMSVKYPRTYIEAFIAHSSGYYAFTPEYTETQRYGPGSHANVGMTIFNWVEDSRFDKDILCSYIPSLNSVRTVLDNWAKVWHQLPIVNLTDIKPLYTWAIVVMAWVLTRRKKYLELLPILACLIMILTCIASPVNDCFRYYAPVSAAFPALFTLFTPDHTQTKSTVK